MSREMRICDWQKYGACEYEGHGWHKIFHMKTGSLEKNIRSRELFLLVTFKTFSLIGLMKLNWRCMSLKLFSNQKPDGLEALVARDYIWSYL